MSEKEQPDRLAFFRTLSLGALGGGAAYLFAKAVKSGEDCIGDGKCRACLSLKKCDLPLAVEHRGKKQIDIKNVKGSLSYKRDLIRKMKEEQQHG